jgi:hypothetical protein
MKPPLRFPVEREASTGNSAWLRLELTVEVVGVVLAPAVVFPAVVVVAPGAVAVGAC